MSLFNFRLSHFLVFRRTASCWASEGNLDEFCVKEHTEQILWSVTSAVWSSRKASWAHVGFSLSLHLSVRFSSPQASTLDGLYENIINSIRACKFHEPSIFLLNFLTVVSKQSAAWRLTVHTARREMSGNLSLSLSLSRSSRERRDRREREREQRGRERARAIFETR